MWWYWYNIYIYIYIMMAHNIKIYFFSYKIFDDKISVRYKLWICCKNFFFFLKGWSHTPMLANSTYWVISLSPPFISPYRYIRGIIGVEIPGSQQLRIILWDWRFYYYFYDIKHCTGELFWGCFIFGGLELWHLWWDFRLLISFI